MINKLKNIFRENKKFYVLGITLNKNSEVYSLLEIFYDDGELAILNKLDFSELNDATGKYLKKDHPIIIHLTGESVLSKEVNNTVGYRNNLIFKSNPDEFYFYEYHQENSVFASFTRTDAVEAILKKINELDKFVVHITLGPFVLNNLLLTLKEEEILACDNYELKIKDQSIESFKKTENNNKSYRLGDEVLNGKEVILVASLIDYLYPNDHIKIDSETLNFNKEQFRYKKRFKFYGAVVILFILSSLFISHFILQSNIRELAEKESLLSISNQSLAQLNELTEERALKERVLMSSGVVDNNYAVRYFSDLGKSIPSSISLDYINLKKPLKKIKSNEKVLFNLKTIEISGYTTDDNAFNNWVKTLKNIKWVKEIEIVKYEENSKSENSFLIDIVI